MWRRLALPSLTALLSALLSTLLSAPASAQTAPELVVSAGHAGGPSAAAFAGGYLATASWSNVALIDLSSGLTIGNLPHGSLVSALEASPAGNVLAVGTCRHAIQLWDVTSQRLLRRLSLPQECAESVSFSLDGALLATGDDGCCTGGGIQIWDVRIGTLTRTLAEGTRVRKVVFSGDGRWVAGIDDAGKAHVFDWPSGQQLRTLEGLDHAGWSESAALASADGRYFAWLEARGLQVWDVSTGAKVLLPGARTAENHAITRDGSELGWTGLPVEAMTAEFLSDGRLAYVDQEQIVIATLPHGAVQAMPLSEPKAEWLNDHLAIIPPTPWLKIRRDGLTLAGAFRSRTVLWNIAASKLRELTSPAVVSPTSLQWRRDGLIVFEDLASDARAWNGRSGEPVDVAGDVDPVEALGSRLRERMRLAFPEDHTTVEYVAFSADGRWIAAGLEGAHPALAVWPSSRSGPAVTLDSNALTYGPQPPAFSADSRWLASFSKGASVKLWATESWTLERTWDLPGTGRRLAFAPDGSRLAVAGDGEAAIWDSSTGRKLVTLSTPGSNQITEIAWSPKGDRVVTSADDGVLRLWNASDGRLLASLFMLEAGRDWLLVTPDGRLDGSERALTRLVAWRDGGGRVTTNEALTRRHRVRRLWHALSSTAAPH